MEADLNSSALEQSIKSYCGAPWLKNYNMADCWAPGKAEGGWGVLLRALDQRGRGLRHWDHMTLVTRSYGDQMVGQEGLGGTTVLVFCVIVYFIKIHTELRWDLLRFIFVGGD